jgi:hypothetical protein
MPHVAASAMLRQKRPVNVCQELFEMWSAPVLRQTLSYPVIVGGGIWCNIIKADKLSLSMFRLQ